MQIKLLHYTPEYILNLAASVPYQTESKENLGNKVFKLGHRSIARHGSAVFEVKNVSQSLLAQLSRHPHLNLTVQSSRYCDMSLRPFYTPLSELAKIGGSADEFAQDMERIMEIYIKWKLKEGKTKEADVAKLFLPKASTVDLVVSGNYQALYEFIQLRLCVRVETEIRTLAKQMAQLLANHISIFGGMDCVASNTGICLEFKSCGKYTKKQN